MLGAVLQDLHACASSDWDEIFLCDILLEIVLAHNSKKSALNFLQRVVVNEQVLIMEVELVLICANFSTVGRSCVFFYIKECRRLCSVSLDLLLDVKFIAALDYFLFPFGTKGYRLC